MRNFFTCQICISEQIKAAGTGQIDLEASHFNFKSLNNDGVYYLKCKLGHETYFLDQSSRFQNLFQSGCYALLDGYHREAVSSFAASLERFYETIIRALLMKNEVSDSIIDSSWKLVKKQSERQLGAFIFLYLREYGRVPQILSDAETSFRNEVIHSGYLPSFDEAVNFGEGVVNIQRVIVNEVMDRDEKYWIKQFGKEIEQKQKLIPAGAKLGAGMNPGLIINPFFRDGLKERIDFKAALKPIAAIKNALERISREE